jgi:predicted CoA-binding protein
MDQRMLNLLREAKVIAVVGISNKPERPSHEVAAYLQGQGYRIIPVNPGLSEVLGKPCFPTLAACGEAVDIVDIFRASDAVPPIVEEAIATGAKSIWMQEGVLHGQAAVRAELAGLQVVQDLCIKKVLMSYGGRP